MKPVATVLTLFLWALCSCSTPVLPSVAAIIQKDTAHRANLLDSTVLNINVAGDITIIARPGCFPDRWYPYYILAKKNGNWHAYRYQFRSTDYPQPTAIASINNKDCEDVLSFILRKKVFEMADENSMPLCPEGMVLDGCWWQIYLGAKGKMIERGFDNPETHDKYCPVYNRTVFIQSFHKIMGLFSAK